MVPIVADNSASPLHRTSERSAKVTLPVSTSLFLSLCTEVATDIVSPIDQDGGGRRLGRPECPLSLRVQPACFNASK